jgi:hypothetical protein
MPPYVRNKILRKKAPYVSNLVGGAGFTLGAETANARVVTVQLRDEVGKSLTVRGHVGAFLAGDAAGGTVAPSPPDTSVLGGANGHLVAGSVPDTCMLIKSGLAVDAVTTKFKTTATTYFQINRVQYNKAAATALVFSAAHVVATAGKWGIILIQTDAAGAVTTKVPAATPTTPMTYASSALALAALPAPDAGRAALGYILLQSPAGSIWTGNTNDLVAASGVQAVSFVDAPELKTSPHVALTSGADGKVDVVITETGVKTFYLAVRLPDGSLVVSPAIAFV